MNDDPDLKAALYALGLEDPADAADLDSAVGQDSPLGRAIDLWSERFIALDGDAESASAPGARVWEKIEAGLDAGLSAPQTRTIAPDEGVWETLTPGVERKVVSADAAEGAVSYYVRMKAGAVMPAHRHAHDEHCVVLEGDLDIGDVRVVQGAYHLARKGVRHPRIVAVTDALFYIQVAA